MTYVSARQPIILRAPESLLDARYQVILAQQERIAAELAAIRAAKSASTAEAVSGPTYPSTVAGLAATSDGESFAVDNGDGTVTIYLNDEGVAVEQRTLATTDALAANGGAELVGTADGDLQDALNLRIIHVTSRTTMKALNVDRFKACQLREGRREGMFTLHAGVCPTDPNEGIYIPSNTSGYYWERVWNYVVGEPEWFGAGPNDEDVDSTSAIQWCIILCPITQLMAANYYIGLGMDALGDIAIMMGDSHKVLRGAGPSQVEAYTRRPGAGEAIVSPTTATRLVVKSSHATAILLGKETNPGSDFTLYTEGSRIENLSICLHEDYDLVNPSSGFLNACYGIKMQFAAVCQINNVWTAEQSAGIYVGGTVACRLTGNRHLRYKEGSAPGNDFAFGILHDNSVSTQYNGGNASTYYANNGFFSNAGTSGAPAYTDNAGMLLHQGWVDTFIHACETANAGHGILGRGNGGSAVNWNCENLTIAFGVFDGCRYAGIRLQNSGPNSEAKVIGNYLHVSNATGPVAEAISIDDVHGAMVFLGNQLVASAGNPATGFAALNSSGFVESLNTITNMQDPVILSGCTAFEILSQVNVGVQSVLTAAVQLTNCDTGYLRPKVTLSNGALPAVPVGVLMHGTGNKRIEVNVSSIHTPSVGSSAANKLVHNGTAITARGDFGDNNLAQGIFA